MKFFESFFLQRKKTAFALRTFALEMKEQREQKSNSFGLCRVVTELDVYQIEKEVWVSGRNQHTANVPNSNVPKVRILLLPQMVR